MPELMFRRVPVGSLMPMQGESTAKGKFNHWEEGTLLGLLIRSLSDTAAAGSPHLSKTSPGLRPELYEAETRPTYGSESEPHPIMQRNLKGTIDFLQKRDIPYTLRCTPLSYEVVPQPQLFKDKGIPNGFVEMEKRQER
ncbi:hypothetical protein JHK85_002862 [Glycine max]|nr:hypothetical protein JHK85_002862 [Glycine max]